MLTSRWPAMKPSPPTIARIAPVLVSSDTIAASNPCAFAGSWLRASSACCLQVGVERGVDAQTAAEEPVVPLLVGVAEDVRLVQQVVAQRLGVVRAGVRPGRDRLRPGWQHELLEGQVGVGLRQLALVDEPVEHLDQTGTAALGGVIGS